jgi:branched-chain amino acid transport system substrate-binding protein
MVMIAAAIATVGATAAWGSGAAKPPIVIAAAMDLSGQMTPFDAPALESARLEAAKINAKGGVLGRKLVIQSCDTQNSKPDVSASCSSNLIAKKAAIGLVTCDVDFATPSITPFLNKGILTIAPCIGTDQMGPKRFGSKGRLAFSMGNVAQDEGAAMAEWAFKVKHWRTAITVSDKLTVYFQEIPKAFAVRFKQLGGKIVDEESYTSGDKTIGSVVSRINAHKADVIATGDIFADYSAEVAGLRSLGNNTPILNSWAGDGTFWYPKSPKVSNYWYVTFASAFGDDPNPQVRALIAQMKKAGQPPATGGFVTGAATIDAIVAAIKANHGSTNGLKLAKTFEHFRGLPTISGKISFTPKLHTVFGRAYRVMNVTNSKPHFVQLFTASSPANIG